MSASRESDQLPHPHLGEFLARRSRCGMSILGAIVLGMLGASLVTMGVLAYNNGGGLGALAAFVGTALPCFVGGAWTLRRSFKSIVFYHLGAVLSCGHRSLITIPYPEADRFDFGVTRQYINGIYTGTTLNLRLSTPDKRRITYSGRFNLKAKGFFKRQYEIHDEMEGVKQIIAEQMAVGMLDRVLAGERLEWGRVYAISSEGLTFLRGKRKGELLPFSSLVSQNMQAGFLYLFQPGQERSRDGIAMSSPNFWPYYFVFLRLAGWIAVAPEPDVPPTADPSGASNHASRA